MFYEFDVLQVILYNADEVTQAFLLLLQMLQMV